MTYAEKILKEIRATYASDRDATLLALGVLDDRHDSEVNFWCSKEPQGVLVGLVGGQTMRKLGDSWGEALKRATEFRAGIEAKAVSTP